MTPPPTPISFLTLFSILQNEIPLYPLWFSWNMDPSEALLSSVTLDTVEILEPICTKLNL